MKKRDLVDLKNKSVEELTVMAKDMKKTVIESRLELKLQKSKNVHEAKNKRKSFAQLLTFVRIKQLGKTVNLNENKKTKKEDVDGTK